MTASIEIVSCIQTMTIHSSKSADKEEKLMWLTYLMTAGTILISIVVGTEVFILDELYSRTYPHRKIEKGILKAKCTELLTRGPHVERKELNDYLSSCLQVSRSHAPWWTTVVYGPCGSGKSAAVRNILKEQEAVVHVILNKGTEDEFVNKVLQKVCPLVGTYNKDDSVYMLSSALRSMSDKNPRIVPTLLIEVNMCHSPDHLLDLLYLLKVWVHRQCLVNAVVVLSPRYELGDTLRHDVRAHVVTIGNLTEEETKEYLLGICDYKHLKGSQEEKEQLAKELAPITENRFCYLQDLADNVQEGGTLEDLKTLVHKQAEHLKTSNEMSLREFLSMFMQSVKFNQMLQNLLTNERVYLLKFYQYMKKTTPIDKQYSYSDLRTKINKILFRPFDIHPETSEVTIRSSSMRKTLEKHLNRK